MCDPGIRACSTFCKINHFPPKILAQKTCQRGRSKWPGGSWPFPEAGVICVNVPCPPKHSLVQSHSLPSLEVSCLARTCPWDECTAAPRSQVRSNGLDAPLGGWEQHSALPGTAPASVSGNWASQTHLQMLPPVFSHGLCLPPPQRAWKPPSILSHAQAPAGWRKTAAEQPKCPCC